MNVLDWLPLAALATWADVAQAIVTGTAVLVAGWWARQRFYLPDSDEPSADLLIHSVTWTQEGDRLLLRFGVHNPHRIGLRAGRLALMVSRMVTPPSSLTAAAPVSFMIRPAWNLASSILIW